MQIKHNKADTKKPAIVVDAGFVDVYYIIRGAQKRTLVPY